jgi:hypothetical protein
MFCWPTQRWVQSLMLTARGGSAPARCWPCNAIAMTFLYVDQRMSAEQRFPWRHQAHPTTNSTCPGDVIVLANLTGICLMYAKLLDGVGRSGGFAVPSYITLTCNLDATKQRPVAGWQQKHSAAVLYVVSSSLSCECHPTVCDIHSRRSRRLNLLIQHLPTLSSNHPVPWCLVLGIVAA